MTPPVHFENIQGILLDIEGTTSSISFVYDEMFPFVRRELDSFLSGNWSDSEVQAACQQIVSDADGNCELTQTAIRDEVIRLMDNDVKATGLKSLQGLIWKSGFANGELVAHVYDDVLPALKRWKEAGIDIRVYSSGSVAAQKLFFGHTEHGSLLEFFSGHYDTTTGPKREPDSYRTIATEFGHAPDCLLFLSDVAAETAAAAESGWHTSLTIRPGNEPVGENQPRNNSFDSIQINSKQVKTQEKPVK